MSKHKALDTFGRSGNPVIRSSAFDAISSDPSDRMTLDGAVNKTSMLLIIVASSAAISWIFNSNPIVQLMTPIGYIAALVSMVATFGFWFPFVGMIVKRRPHLAPKTAFIYAAGMGLVIGSISLNFEKAFPGIVIEAVSLTFFVAASLCFLYKSGIVKPDNNFALIIFSATMGIIFFYIGVFIYSLIVGNTPAIFSSNSNTSILLSIFIVAIAALNLVLDFDIIEQSAEAGAPKYMEYFGAMALVVTLVWLYIEILRLLAKLRSR